MFLEKWNENTDIDWWNDCRKELNIIIQTFNDWQLEGFNYGDYIKLIALIEYGKQTIGERDGRSGYMEKLEEMEQFVKLNSY
jgi:hypothetical protein